MKDRTVEKNGWLGRRQEVHMTCRHTATGQQQRGDSSSSSNSAAAAAAVDMCRTVVSGRRHAPHTEAAVDAGKVVRVHGEEGRPVLRTEERQGVTHPRQRPALAGVHREVVERAVGSGRRVNAARLRRRLEECREGHRHLLTWPHTVRVVG